MARRRIAVLASAALAAAALVGVPSTTASAAPVINEHPHVAAASGPVLSGIVTDTAGEPLRGVDVYVLNGGSSTTGSDGAYSLNVAPGKRRVYFDGESATTSGSGGTGYIGVAKTFQIGTKPVQAAPMILPKGAAVSGRVADQQGHPLRYATMLILPIDQNSPYVDAGDDEGDFPAPINFGVSQTRASGRFAITGLAGGAALVCFDAQDLEGVPTGGSAGNYGYNSVCSSRPVALVPGQTVSVARLALPTAHDGEIVGQVIRPDGRPIPYVDVMLNGRNNPYLDTDAYAGRNGRFQSPAVPPGRYEACAFPFFDSNHPTGGLYTDCVENERVTAGKVTHLTIQAVRGAAARGTVLSRSGRPLSGVSAIFRQLDVASPYSGGATSNRHGHFTNFGMPAGRYEVCFSGAGFFSESVGPNDPTGVLSTCAHPTQVTLRAGRLLSGIVGRPQPGGAIGGRVTDPDGRPFTHPSGIQLSIGPDFVTVAKDGTFLAPGLADRTYRVCATSYAPAIVGKSCAPSRVKVVAGKIAGGVHLVLRHAYRVVVATVDTSGHPLAGVNVTLLAPCTSHESSQGNCSTQPLFSTSKQVVVAASGSTDSAGTSTLYAQTAGSYSLCVYGYWAASATDNVSTGYGDACHDTTFGTSVGSKRVSLTQTVAAAGAVIGQILDAAGDPVAGARIAVTNSGATDYRPAPNQNGDDEDFGEPSVPTPKSEARTDANGQYTIYSVAAGDQQVCATTPKKDGSHRGCLAAPVMVVAGSMTSAPVLSISS